MRLLPFILRRCFRYVHSFNLVESLAIKWEDTIMHGKSGVREMGVIPQKSIRQSKTSLLTSVPDAPVLEGVDMNPGEPSESQTPGWLTETRINK